jgi:hypothetical protein
MRASCRFAGTILQFALITFSWSAAADGRQDCERIFDRVPKNTVDVTDRSQELLKYGHLICSSEWKRLSDVQQSHQSMSLSILSYIGLDTNEASASSKFSEWKKANCDNTDLKKEVHTDLVTKQSFVSDLVYHAYETCVAQRATNNAATCAFIPTASAENGFLFVYFSPNTGKGETVLNAPITLTNGIWENKERTLPKTTQIRQRENFFPITRTDTTKGDFLRVSLEGSPGDCSVEIPPWPTFTATVTLKVFYTQAAHERTAPAEAKWTSDSPGPSFFCLKEEAARKTLKWTDDKEPIDFDISDPHTDLKGWGKVSVPLYKNEIDKRCWFFGSAASSDGTYTLQVNGVRKRLLGKFERVLTSRGEPLVVRVADTTLPSDAMPGSKPSFEYEIAISEQRGDVSRPVVKLTNDSPADRGYRSSIDSTGTILLMYQ